MKRTPRLMRSIFIWFFFLIALTSLAAQAEVTVVEGCDPSTIRRGGREDDFALPTDFAFLSDELDAAVDPPLGWKDFDDPTVNLHLGHRFRILPPNIVKAVLKIRMAPGLGQSDNDGLALGLNPPDPNNSTFAYSVEIDTLPEANGTWESGINPPTTFTLDLSDLPGGGDILDKVIADRFLDIRVQDDTTVDYAKLHIWTCTPSTYRVGGIDEFAAPLDPVSRSAALSESFTPPIGWKPLDDSRSNRFVGHTFRSLPPNIIKAEIEVRMRPVSAGANNDTWNLGLDLSGPDPTFTQAIRIRETTRSGMWKPETDEATTFIFDFESLSNGTALLAKMAADVFLDVVIQDDTEVDYMLLRVWACPQRPVVTGWPHHFEGDVRFAFNAANRFEVFNLAPEEPMTIGVDLANVAGYCMRLEETCVGKEGTAIDLAIDAKTVDGEFEVSGVLSLSGTDPVQIDVFFDPDDRMDVNIWNDEERVAGFFFDGGGPVVTVPPDTCIQEFDFIGKCFSVLLTGPFPVTVLTDGQPTHVGNRIEICPALIQFREVTLETFELTTVGFPELILTESAVEQFGLLSSALGNATFEPAIDRLTLADLTDSGEDGIAVALEDAAFAQIAFDPLDPAGDALPGSALHVGLRGILDPARGTQHLCDFWIDKMGAGVDTFRLTADFSAINSETDAIEIRRDGRVVRRFPGRPEASVQAPLWPIAVAAQGGDDSGLFVTRFPAGTAFEVDGTVVRGDEVRLIAETPDVDIVSFSEIALRSTGLDEITLTDIEAATCAADDTVLCLNDGRFEVTIEWRTPSGESGVGQAARLTDDTGSFWFFSADNIEVVIKVLDACGFADHFWVFAAGLTDVEVEITVTDTVTGAVRTYSNPLGSPFQPIIDTRAFATCRAEDGAVAGPPDEIDTASSRLESPQGDTVPLGGIRGGDTVVKDAEILLNDERFRIGIEWETASGEQGVGEAVRLTSDSGYFWFFSADNVEVVIKVLDACGFADRFWVFAAGLTDVGVEITVTDTETGAVKTYSNRLGTPFQPILDTRAFATCP